MDNSPVSLAERRREADPYGGVDAAKCTKATDVANARKFAEINGQFVRHTPAWGWIAWDGVRWRRDDARRVQTAAFDIGEKLTAEAVACRDRQIAEALFRHAKYSQSRSGIAAMLSLAEGLLHVDTAEFDTLPYMLTCRNVTLDFSRVGVDREVQEHMPHCQFHMNTRTVPFDWNAGARCPHWLAFLEAIMPDEGVREFLQRAVGYSLLGICDEQCFFTLYGKGSNGKSTFLNTLMHVLGSDYAQQGSNSTFLASRRGDGPTNDLARIRGARFLSVIETGEGKRLNEELVKQFTGGDPITARFLHKEFFEFTPEAKLWIASNYKPTVRGTDEGIWRRIRLIPFEAQVSEKQRDKKLARRLKGEAEGILNWAVQGACAYLRDGLSAPEVVTSATNEYRSEQDTLAEFLEDCCEEDTRYNVPAGELYLAYREWAGKVAMSQTAFGRIITEKGFDKHKSMGVKVYGGLRLKDASND